MTEYDPLQMAEPRVPHERDCAPCDAAKKVAAAIAAAWDPNDSWETPTPYPPYARPDLPDEERLSLLDDLAHRAAETLHEWIGR